MAFLLDAAKIWGRFLEMKRSIGYSLSLPGIPSEWEWTGGINWFHDFHLPSPSLQKQNTTENPSCKSCTMNTGVGKMCRRKLSKLHRVFIQRQGSHWEGPSKYGSLESFEKCISKIVCLLLVVLVSDYRAEISSSQEIKILKLQLHWNISLKTPPLTPEKPWQLSCCCRGQFQYWKLPEKVHVNQSSAKKKFWYNAK